MAYLSLLNNAENQLIQNSNQRGTGSSEKLQTKNMAKGSSLLWLTLTFSWFMFHISVIFVNISHFIVLNFIQFM